MMCFAFVSEPFVFDCVTFRQVVEGIAAQELVIEARLCYVSRLFAGRLCYVSPGGRRGGCGGRGVYSGQGA